jgi:uncharacterized membrane protein HdeD (DUF308 family)
MTRNEKYQLAFRYIVLGVMIVLTSVSYVNGWWFLVVAGLFGIVLNIIILIRTNRFLKARTSAPDTNMRDGD